jgi:hypothetical protein
MLQGLNVTRFQFRQDYRERINLPMYKVFLRYIYKKIALQTLRIMTQYFYKF